MRSLSRRLLFRVFAPEGEILSFAQPLESIQRKGGLIVASSCAPGDARHPCHAPLGYSQQNLRCSARQTRLSNVAVYIINWLAAIALQSR